MFCVRARKYLTVCVCACGVFAHCEADADCKLTICRYLVAVNVCVFVYSTLQFVQLAYTVILGISFIPSILISTWLTFGCDQVGSFFLSFEKLGEETGFISVCFGCSGVGQNVSTQQNFVHLERHIILSWKDVIIYNIIYVIKTSPHYDIFIYTVTMGSVHLTSKHTIRHAGFDR